jgi:hypothetical protein
MAKAEFVALDLHDVTIQKFDCGKEAGVKPVSSATESISSLLIKVYIPWVSIAATWSQDVFLMLFCQVAHIPL